MKPKDWCDLLYYSIRLTMVVWNWAHSISQGCLPIVTGCLGPEKTSRLLVDNWKNHISFGLWNPLNGKSPMRKWDMEKYGKTLDSEHLLGRAFLVVPSPLPTHLTSNMFLPFAYNPLTVRWLTSRNKRTLLESRQNGPKRLSFVVVLELKHWRHKLGQKEFGEVPAVFPIWKCST